MIAQKAAMTYVRRRVSDAFSGGIGFRATTGAATAASFMFIVFGVGCDMFAADEAPSSVAGRADMANRNGQS